MSYSWGDGLSTSSGTAFSDPGTQSPVYASHAYTATGTYTITVTTTATYAAGGTDAATASYSVAVTEASMSPPPMSPATVTITGIQTATEGETAGVFRFSRTGDTGQPLGVSFNFGGTATSLIDYNVPPSITIPAGAVTADLTITATDDADSELTETITLTLNGSSDYTPGTPSAATINLYDNEAQIVSVSNAGDATEGGTDGVLTFTRTGDLGSPLTVGFTVGGTAAANEDYGWLLEEVTFAAGVATADVPVSAAADGVYDPGETVTAAVAAGAGYTAESPTPATITIADTVAVSVAKVTDAVEGGAVGAFLFTRTGDTSQPLTLSYGVSGSADPAADFISLSGTVVIPAGDASAIVYLTPREDALVEGTEDVTVFVIDIPDVAVADPTSSSATAMISDNDAGLVIQESALTTEVQEGDSDTYTVSLSVPPSDAVTVTITAQVPLLFASDSQPSPSASLTLTFTPTNWDVPQLVRVSAPDNGVSDGDRTVQVTHGTASADPRYAGITSALLVVVQDKANPDPKQTADYWKEVARKRIDLSSLPDFANRDQLDLGRLRNIRINAAYAELAAANKTTFYWMGLSPFASENAGRAMDYVINFGKYVRDGLQPAAVRANGLALAEGNWNVYNDMYWQHLAFAHGGIALMRQFKERNQITQAHLDAWEKIAEGVATNNQDKVWEGNKMLLEYEQKVTLQPSFDKLKGLGLLNYVVNSPVPGGKSFTDYKDPDYGVFKQRYVTDFDARWSWIKGAVVPEWKAFVADYPDEVAKFYKKMADHEIAHKFK